MKKLCAAFTVAAAIIMAAPSYANNPDSLSFYDLDGVVITATRTPLALKESPVITRVITARDMERKGVATIQEALEDELAGVEFHQAGYGSSISFQGLDARYVLFLVDGERMAGETYGNIDFARIPMTNIDRIEIVRGAASVLYGSNAMGAVVNIITRMPEEKVEVNFTQRFGTPFQNNQDEELGGSATPEDIDIYRSRLDLSNYKNDLSVGLNLGKFRSLTTAAYRTVDAYRLTGTRDEVRTYKAGQLQRMRPNMIQLPNGMWIPEIVDGMPVFVVGSTNAADTTVIVGPDQRGLSISGWKDWSVGQRFDYALSDKFRFEVSGNYYEKQRFDFNGSILDDNPMSNNTKPWTFESYEGYNVKGLMEHTPNRNNKIYLSMVRDEYFRNLDSLSGVSTRKQNHIYNNPRLLWTLNAGRWNRFTTGLELLNEQLRFDLNPNGYDDKKSLNTASLYIQDEISMKIPLSFVAGMRGDWNDKFGWHATPKVSAKYDFGKFILRANYASGYRNPGLKELYMELRVPIVGNTYIRGNENLKPETNNYISFSAEYLNDWLNLSATAYNSYFRNKIDIRGTIDGTTTIYQYQNVDQSEYGGLELLARIKLADDLYVRANYNYLYQAVETSDETTQAIFPSPHTATLQADYGFMLNTTYFNVNASARYVGPKNYEDMMSIVDMSGGGMTNAKFWMGNYSARHDGYLVCNAAVNIYLQEWYTVSLGVDNIFNQRAEVINFNSSVTAPRNFFVQMSYKFNSGSWRRATMR